MVSLITLLSMAVLCAWMTIDDLRKLSIKFILILMTVFIGYIGIIINHAINGCFTLWDLTPFPIYIGLYLLNSKFNKAKILGRADVDIINGTLALIPGTIVYFYSQSYILGDNDFSSQVASMNVFTYFEGIFGWLAAGCLATLIIAACYAIIKKIKGEKVDRKTKIPISTTFMFMLLYSVYAII